MKAKDIQKALAALGYNVGPIDGIIGRKTRAAVRAFQTDAKIGVDGIVGPVTISALLVATGKSPVVTKPGQKRNTRLIHTLVWHTTATPEGVEFSVDQIRDMHLRLGWSNIGYHKLIHLDGSVSDGMPEDRQGIHVRGHNVGTLGYSYVGGVTKDGKAIDSRTDAQKETMIRLTKEAIERYDLRAVLGHRDLSPDLDGDGLIESFEWVKMCPCFNAIPEYGHLLKK